MGRWEQRLRGAQGTDRVGWRGRREEKGDSTQLPGAGQSGVGEFPSPWFQSGCPWPWPGVGASLPLPQTLQRLSRCLFLSKPCAVHNLPTSGLQLSHDRISTTPGEGRQLEASTGRNLGHTTSGGLFTGGLQPRPLPFRPHPLTRAQGRLAPPHLRLDCSG